MYADLLKNFMTAEHDAVDKLIEQTGAQCLLVKARWYFSA